MSSQTVGESFTLTKNVYSLNNYIFKGWSNTIDGKDVMEDDKVSVEAFLLSDEEVITDMTYQKEKTEEEIEAESQTAEGEVEPIKAASILYAVDGNNQLTLYAQWEEKASQNIFSAITNAFTSLFSTNTTDSEDTKEDGVLYTEEDLQEIDPETFDFMPEETTNIDDNGMVIDEDTVEIDPQEIALADLVARASKE